MTYVQFQQKELRKDSGEAEKFFLKLFPITALSLKRFPLLCQLSCEPRRMAVGCDSMEAGWFADYANCINRDTEMIVVASEPFNDAVPLILAALGELNSSAPTRVSTHRFLLAGSSLIGHGF